jgi:hypothetical protein
VASPDVDKSPGLALENAVEEDILTVGGERDSRLRWPRQRPI